MKNTQDMSKFLPTHDLIFKKLFGNQNNSDITKDFASKIINKEIKSIKIKDSSSQQSEYLDQKNCILDIEAVIDNDIICDIEMQVEDDEDIFERILFYWNRLYINQKNNVSGKQTYKNMKKTIVILIMKYQNSLTDYIPKLKTKWNIREENCHNIILTDKLEFYIINLKKLKQKDIEIGNTDLLPWLKFLMDPKSLEEKDMLENKYLKEVEEKYKGILSDYDIRGIAWRMEAAEIDKNSREKREREKLKKAVKETKEKEKQRSKKEFKKKQLEIAKELLKMNLTIEQIMQATKLTKKEIEKIN